jgi:hypothetical protein
VGYTVQVCRTDDGGEFDTRRIATCTTEKGLHWEYTAGYTHAQNSKGERVGLTTLAKVRAVLHDSISITNASPVSGKGVNPFEAFTVVPYSLLDPLASCRSYELSCLRQFSWDIELAA